MNVLVTGSGEPVTLVAHGLGASVAETRALVGGLHGTKVFPEARGHGTAPLPEIPGYEELATDLLAVADAHGARQALGVSMGAHTVLRILSTDPTRFDRLVLFLPASIDTPVRRTPSLVDALASGDRTRVRAAVQEELGSLSGDAVERYAAARTEALLTAPGLPLLLPALAADRPVADRSVLSAVSAEVLVLGQGGDALHPAQIARELAAVLPHARLVVFDRPGAAFQERARLRELIFNHLRGQ